MNYAVKTDRVCTAGAIYSDSSEQTVDADLKLPDYCPDIQKILKCRLEPQIESRGITGDRLIISGTAAVRVIYIDAIKGAVRCAEQSYPFEISSNLSGSPQSAVISTDIRVSYLNCRALSPRRLNIHGAFIVDVKVTDKTDNHLCVHVKGDDIQQKKLTLDYSSLKTLTQQQFSVTEALETGQNGTSVQAVVRSDIRAVTKDSAITSGKMLYKGELLVKLMYLSDLETGKPETMEYSIPFSQVIAMESSGDDGEYTVRAEVLNSTVTLKNEIGFDDPLPVISARLCVTVLSFEKCDITPVTDCYSTSYRARCERAKYSLPLLSSVINETVVEKTNVDLTDSSVAGVLDVWCEKGAVLCENPSGKAVLRGKYNICVLACDSDDAIFYTERTLEYSRDIKALAANAEIDSYVSAEIVSVGYRICSEKRIEVRTELLVSGELYEIKSVNAVTSVTADENAPNVRDTEASLILYYARKGEDVWTIAQEYSTSAEKVRTENDLTEDILPEDMMIMLPV